MMVPPGEMMTHWVFHLFSTNGGKVVDHPVHQPAFGLAHIVHATLEIYASNGLPAQLSKTS